MTRHPYQNFRDTALQSNTDQRTSLMEELRRATGISKLKLFCLSSSHCTNYYHNQTTPSYLFWKSSFSCWDLLSLASVMCHSSPAVPSKQRNCMCQQLSYKLSTSCTQIPYIAPRPGWLPSILSLDYLQDGKKKQTLEE